MTRLTAIGTWIGTCVGLAAVVAALPSIAAAQTGRAQVSGYVTVTSDYRNRGLSQSRGDPSLQLGGDYQHPSGFFGGGRAATVEYAVPGAARAASSTQTEVALYAGFNRRVGVWSLAASLGRYLYSAGDSGDYAPADPDAPAHAPDYDYDYDYGELSGSVGFRNRYFLTASYVDDFFGSGASALNHEIGLALPVAADFELGAGIGRFESSGLDVDFTHWHIGASRVFGRLGLDLRFYDNSHTGGYYAGHGRAVGPLRASTPDTWVLSLSYGFDAGR